ncbi:MAG: Crp/Fnr family transcriptional regulator [Candidatus Manganitrophaceae bacterium]
MNTDEKTLSLLKSVSSFADLAPNVRATLADHCQSKCFRAGQFVFMEGDLCQHLYILESGRVKFFRTSAEGREQILKVFDRPGDTFCIPSAFCTGRHIVSASALTETRLRLLDLDTLNRVAKENPSIALKLVATAGEHMTHLVALAEDLSLRSATARLAKYLCGLAVAEGAESGKEIRLSRDRLPEEELASLLGTVRVHISRSLVNLVQAGAIDLTRAFVRVRDLTLLKRISEGK